MHLVDGIPPGAKATGLPSFDAVKILFTTISGPVLGLLPFIAMYLMARSRGDVFIAIAVGVLVLSYLNGCKKDFKRIVDSLREIGYN